MVPNHLPNRGVFHLVIRRITDLGFQMDQKVVSIDICICTYERPSQLRNLLEELAHQEVDGQVSYSIVVVDNDRNRSAEDVVASFKNKDSGIRISYHSEAIPNIARARNKCVSESRAEFLAFIDDDEVPLKGWLMSLLKSSREFDAEGVLGPVLPHYGGNPPLWLVKGGFYDRRRYRTGFELKWEESRSGNMLIRRKVVDELGQVFREEFGSGGEDLDFFRRSIELGHRYIWCDEAPVYETVPPHRWALSFLLKRALLRGSICVKHPRNRVRNIIKSIVALPMYSIALPFLLIGGRHRSAKYLVKMFDHAGRLLAMVKLNPMTERNH